MIVKVEFEDHDRVYTIGIQSFLKKLKIDVKDEQIVRTIKKLLEQEEMHDEQS